MGPNFGYGPFTEALHSLEKLPLAPAELQWGFVGHVPAASQSVNCLARANVLAHWDRVKRLISSASAATRGLPISGPLAAGAAPSPRNPRRDVATASLWISSMLVSR